MVVMVKIEVITARKSEIIGNGKDEIINRGEIINRDKKKMYGLCDTKTKKKN